MTYDKHTRRRALWLADSYLGDGSSLTAAFAFAAARLLIGASTIFGWYHMRDVTGIIAPARKRNGEGQILIPDVHMNYLIDYLVNVDCQLYVKEMKTKIFDEFNVLYTCQQIEVGLKRHDFTQKVVSRIAAEQNNVERQAFRELLKARHLGGLFGAEEFVCVDETHCDVGTARRKYGWALRGQPAFRRSFGTHGHGESFSAICSFGVQGVRTVGCYEGGVNSDVFLHELEHRIIPSMGQLGEPYGTLLLDNASVHKKAEIEALCEAHGCGVLFLPPYSYDFNPIEYVFHLAKTRLREHYHVNDVNSPLIPQFEQAMYECCTPEMACNLFRHCHIYVPDYIQEWAMN